MALSFTMGRVFGVRLRVHWTFLLLAAWIAWVGRGAGGLVGALTALALLAGLFACVVLHELEHSLVAIRFGAQVQAITLLPIGGVATMRNIPERPLHEFLVAVAGPAVNIALFGLLALARRGLPLWAAPFPSEIGWAEGVEILMRANLVMAVFNLAPAFPMDGGRVLRSALGWKLPREEATRWAALVGRAISVGFMALGLWWNPMLTLIGVFIFFGAGREEQAVRLRAALQDVRVRDAMAGPSVILHPDEPLSRCRELAVPGRPDGFAVEQDGRLVGLLTREEWMEAIRRRGETAPVGAAARRHFMALHPEAPLSRVHEALGRVPQSLFPVIENGRLVGLLGHGDVARFLARRNVRVRPRPASKASRFVIDLG